MGQSLTSSWSPITPRCLTCPRAGLLLEGRDRAFPESDGVSMPHWAQAWDLPTHRQSCPGRLDRGLQFTGQVPGSGRMKWARCWPEEETEAAESLLTHLGEVTWQSCWEPRGLLAVQGWS